MTAAPAAADTDIAHYWAHGWMRVPGAFDGAAAAAMRGAIWNALAPFGIAEGDPASWSVERPAHLQAQRGDPVFRAAASGTLRAVIDAAFDGRDWPEPKDWGSLFVAFPGQAAWEIPAGGWHCDAHYLSPVRPAGGVKSFALLGDVVPRGGGTLMLSGSHRLIHDWFAAHPPPSGIRSAEMRKALLAQPYLRELHGTGSREERIARFMDRAEEVDGIALQVVEMTGAAGDVYLLHPLLLHVAAPNETDTPRFLLSGGVTLDQWGWGAAPEAHAP